MYEKTNNKKTAHLHAAVLKSILISAQAGNIKIIVYCFSDTTTRFIAQIIWILNN
ncbi:hypothetical protein [Lactobacillus bombicola]|uniref:hypothetical protein n=1 Tax=Lactobacillus bombicola TaxID=1505723 RepID=UPI001356623C|nr:hypothetical protein [Lactobacillus bombicola]